MKRTTCMLLLALTSGATMAQNRITPGLWEHSAKINSGSGEMSAAMAKMQEQLAAMPPEQRKQMEEAMARQGLSLPGAAGQGMVFKFCITPEKAARDDLPMQEGNCKQTSNTRSGNSLKFKFECSAPEKGTGEGEFTFISSKEYKGRMKITSQRGTREQTMDVETSARWLAADCGETKPRP